MAQRDPIAQSGELPELKLYFDYKSPFAYLAKDPTFELVERYRIAVRWIPFVLRIKGKGERSLYSERKVRYSYMDARRWANRRGGLMIRGPLRIYDSRPALMGALYAQSGGFFREFSDVVFTRFFERALEIDDPLAVAGVVDGLGRSADGYLEYIGTDGPAALEACLDEADADEVFGVPQFVFHDELFWGFDRLSLVEERLTEAGLRR
jgi:2-hydroxychromene-2-carboxylate isomerase